jgi:hypothetical protein
MWNSKSCPEALPHQKKGAMASRQAPGSNNARKIGFRRNLSLEFIKVSGSERAILLHGEILGKLTVVKPLSVGGEVVCEQ